MMDQLTLVPMILEKKERPTSCTTMVVHPRRCLGRVGSDQPPILKTLVPHLGQVPWVAGLPFFMVIF